jgi:hypothetical protein
VADGGTDGDDDDEDDDDEDNDDNDDDEDDDEAASDSEGCRLTTSCSVRAAIATKSDTSVAQLRVRNFR